MNAQEFRQAVEVLPYGKRLPGAVYLLDRSIGSSPDDPSPRSIGPLADDPSPRSIAPLADDLPDDPLPPLLRNICDGLRSRLEIGPEFNLLKFHLDSPKISFLS
jgi:hypothetical protein